MNPLEIRCIHFQKRQTTTEKEKEKVVYSKIWMLLFDGASMDIPSDLAAKELAQRLNIPIVDYYSHKQPVRRG